MRNYWIVVLVIHWGQRNDVMLSNSIMGFDSLAGLPYSVLDTLRLESMSTSRYQDYVNRAVTLSNDTTKHLVLHCLAKRVKCDIDNDLINPEDDDASTLIESLGRLAFPVYQPKRIYLEKFYHYLVNGPRCHIVWTLHGRIRLLRDRGWYVVSLAFALLLPGLFVAVLHRLFRQSNLLFWRLVGLMAVVAYYMLVIVVSLPEIFCE